MVVHATAAVDPKRRVVITGMGVASVFGNDVTKFYDRSGRACLPCTEDLAGCVRAWLRGGVYQLQPIGGQNRRQAHISLRCQRVPHHVCGANRGL